MGVRPLRHDRPGSALYRHHLWGLIPANKADGADISHCQIKRWGSMWWEGHLAFLNKRERRETSAWHFGKIGVADRDGSHVSESELLCPTARKSLETALHKADSSLCELNHHCQQGTIRVRSHVGDMVGFLLDTIVIVLTSGTSTWVMWKYHVISLSLYLPNPYVHRLMPNIRVGHLGSNIPNINPLINADKCSLITRLGPFVEALCPGGQEPSLLMVP